jgi:alkaline phosphatase D
MQSEFLALMSDMHLSPMSKGTAGAQTPQDLPERRIKRAGAALQKINMCGAEVVLLGGDISNDLFIDVQAREIATDFVSRISFPMCIVPGNHDVGSPPGSEDYSQEKLLAASNAFQEMFGPFGWVLEAAGFQVLGINSQLFGSGLPQEFEQKSWFRSKLSKQTDLLRAVLLHTPPYLVAPDDDFQDGSEHMCLSPQARIELLDILDEAPPDLLICGHTHRFWTRRGQTFDWLGLPATSFGLSELAFLANSQVPKGDNRVGWVTLHRQGDTWDAQMLSIE